MIARLMRVEWFKLRKRWMPWILLAIMLAFVALIQFAMYFGYRGLENQPIGPRGNEGERQLALQLLRSALVLPRAVENSFNTARTVGSILMVILTASVIGGEYAWGTIRSNLILGMGRGRYLLSKLLLLLLLALAMLVIVFVVGFIFNMITTLLVAHRIDWGFLDGKFAVRLLAMLGRTWAVIAVPMFLAAMLTIVGRSSALGLSVGIAYAIVEPIVANLFGLIQGWGQQVELYTITYNSTTVMAHNALTGQPLRMIGSFSDIANAATLPSFWKALAILGGYTVFFAVVTFLTFRKRDIPSAS